MEELRDLIVWAMNLPFSLCSNALTKGLEIFFLLFYSVFKSNPDLSVGFTFPLVRLRNVGFPIVVTSF